MKLPAPGEHDVCASILLSQPVVAKYLVAVLCVMLQNTPCCHLEFIDFGLAAGRHDVPLCCSFVGISQLVQNLAAFLKLKLAEVDGCSGVAVVLVQLCMLVHRSRRVVHQATLQNLNSGTKDCVFRSALLPTLLAVQSVQNILMHIFSYSM